MNNRGGVPRNGYKQTTKHEFMKRIWQIGVQYHGWYRTEHSPSLSYFMGDRIRWARLVAVLRLFALPELVKRRLNDGVPTLLDIELFVLR